MNQSQQTAAQPKLITVPINSFLRKKIPPPALVLEPFLPERGLAMIHAET